MVQKAPGKARREGISFVEPADMFPGEATAAAWFGSLVWPHSRHCPRWGSVEIAIASATSGLPYYCPACKRAFSVHIGPAFERSKVPLRKWAIVIYLEMTSLKGVSSMKAPPRSQGNAEDDLVHAAAHPRGVGWRGCRAHGGPLGGR